MLLDVTTKTDKDESQESKTLCSLVSSLDDLSIHETSKKEILDLEYRVLNVSLNDNDGVKQSQEEEEETAGDDDLTVSSEPSEESCSPSAQSDQSETEEDNEKGVDLKETCVDTVSLKEKEISGEDEKKIGKVESDDQEEEKSSDVVQEKEKSSDVVQEEKPGDGKGAEEDEKKDKDESESEKAQPEAAPVVKEKKKVRVRGLGSGTQNDWEYSYPMNQMAYNYNQFTGSSELAPNPYSSQMPQFQAMSPQQAMTPTYSNTGMPVSPMSGYTESNLFSPMQSSDVGYLDNGMSSLEGSFGMSVIPNWNPDTPPSCIQDVNYQQYSPISDQERSASPFVNAAPSLSSPFSPDEVLEAIRKVENDPDSSRIPSEELISIRNQLEEELGSNEFDANEMQASLSGNNAQYQQVQSFMNSYPTVLSPPCEDELAERNAEKQIQQLLDNSKFEKARKRLALITNEDLTSKDADGDNPCVVVACQDANSDRFLENLVAMVERARTINICCEKPIPVVNTGETKTCRVCGNTNQSLFYSPFAMVNNNDDNLLSSVIRAGQSQLVVTYICENIYRRQSDVNRIFGGQHAELYSMCQQAYPVLGRLLSSY